MPDVDDDGQRSALAAIAAARPLAISSPTVFPLSTLDVPLQTLLTCSRSSTLLDRLPSDLLSLQQSPDFIAFILPFFLSSSLNLHPSAEPTRPAPAADSVDLATLHTVERLWRLLRNHCCSSLAQAALLTSPAFPVFLSALSSLSSLSPPPSSLLLTAGQLMANALTANPSTQLYFLPTVLSSLFLDLLHSPVLPFRACLLHCLHLCLQAPASQTALLSHPLSLPLLTCAFTPSSEDEEGAADCELFAQAILTRLFHQQAVFLPSLLPALTADLPTSVSPSPALEWVLQVLDELEVDASDDAAVPLTSNCLALLSLVSSCLPPPATSAPR